MRQLPDFVEINCRAERPGTNRSAKIFCGCSRIDQIQRTADIEAPRKGRPVSAFARALGRACEQGSVDRPVLFKRFSGLIPAAESIQPIPAQAQEQLSRQVFVCRASSGTQVSAEKIE